MLDGGRPVFQQAAATLAYGAQFPYSGLDAVLMKTVGLP